MGDIRIVTAAPRTAPGIRKRENSWQIVKLRSQIAEYALEKGTSLPGPRFAIEAEKKREGLVPGWNRAPAGHPVGETRGR